MDKNTKPDFKDQFIHVGLDTHKNSWKVTERNNKMELKTFSTDPGEKKLLTSLNNRYPGAKIVVAYEAGFTGFSTYRKFKELGVDCLVVHPGHIPTNSAERIQKTDQRDSRKIARELENGSLKSIFIPDEADEAFRSLVRSLGDLTTKTTRVKNQISSFLLCHGLLSSKPKSNGWSIQFRKELRQMKLSSVCLRMKLDLLVDELDFFIQQKKTLDKQLKELNQDNQTIDALMSVSGIGWISALKLKSELISMARFSNNDHLAAFVGLVPATHSSGEHERTLGLVSSGHSELRSLLVEAAWIAVRKDPAMLIYFSKVAARKERNKAIIQVARKLLNRIRAVWISGKDYQFSKTA